MSNFEDLELMQAEKVREYCLKMKAVTESFPFGEDTLVFKVMGKIFALMSLEARTLNLKCDPEKAIALREEFSEVMPGYHMNKTHWNTIILMSSVPEKRIREWISDSYLLVAEGLSLKQRKELGIGIR
jgi:predicted DNA-binding protein (MmcQ/YjbR family)